jgi:uncharacterized membrane protein YbhN (UPF0104 family)
MAGCTHCLAVVTVAVLVAPQSPLVAWAGYAQAVPFIFLGLFIPITPGGLGQREALFTALLGALGVSEAHALSASIVSSALAIFVALLGGVILLVESLLARFRKPAVGTSS